MNNTTNPVSYNTEDLLISLCNSVTHVLGKATHSQIHYSAMVQRITKPACALTLAALCCLTEDSPVW